MSITESHDLECMILDEAAEPKALPFTLLADITDGFSEKLEIGRGGFATVYKGILANGDVAVKRLSNTYMHEKEFHREVECLMKVKHRNIVRFLGYCADTQGNVGNYEGKFVIADRQERLLCFEYLPKGTLHDYIEDASCGLEWRIRYRIIKDICEGLLYLHQKNILHLDLKPGNILLDRNMVAKITDFGLSRCFQEDQTKMIATEVGGTLGYLAPEFTSHVVTPKFDLYSLGVIILEILTGKKGYQDIQNVLDIWSNRLDISQDNPVWVQIKVCADIGLECIKFNPTKRPDMKHILDMLAETEYAEVIPACGPMDLLGVHPLELCLPFEYGKRTPCSLYLTNNTNKRVAFSLFMDESEQDSSNCFVELPVYGIVPPRSAHTLVVTSIAEKEQLEDGNDLILESIMFASADEHDIDSFLRSKPYMFLVKVKYTCTSVVQKVRLKAVRTPPPIENVTSSKSISPQIKMIKAGNLFPWGTMSLDIIHSKQWIIVGHHDGRVRIWNHEAQKLVSLFKVSEEKATCVKFIARKQWFVVGTEHGLIHVYNCETKMRKITSFRSSDTRVSSLAVHPTQSYLLALHSTEMVLWDWDKEWKCAQKFEMEHSRYINQVVFNPKDIIASASDDCRVKVWYLNSSKSKCTFAGHLHIVNCLDFFTHCDQEYLVSGSNDQTAKIWDMQKTKCVRTLEASMSPILAVLYEPKLRILFTASEDGCVYLWCATNSRINSRSPRLERIVNTGFGGPVHGLSYLMGRVVVEKKHAMIVMDIDNNVNNLEESTDDYSGTLSSAYNYTRPARDTTRKVMSSSCQLLDVALELIRLPCEPNEYISLSVHLTNKTDEHVAFMLEDRRLEPLVKLPQYGIVTSRSSYILNVSATKEELARVAETEFYLMLKSSTLRDKYAVLFDNIDECAEFFEDAKEMGNDVHEVAVLLKSDYHAQQSEETKLKIISMKNVDDELCSLDAHPTEAWIITGHTNGDVRTWNSKTQGPMDTFKVSGRSVRFAKFIARKQWMVAVTSDYFIHVYNCACVTKMQKMTSFRDDATTASFLAVHPIHPYVLSTSGNLWDWDKSWELEKNYYGGAKQVAFNLKDTNSFAIVSNEVKADVKVWSSLDSTFPYCALSGHLKDVNCLDFVTNDDRHYLITGSDDCTVKIWDLQKEECIHTMEDIMSRVTCLISLLDRPYLVTGSKHGTVQLWSSTDFRLEGTVNLGGGGPILGLVSSMGSRRVVVGQKHAVSILEIDPEEAVAEEEVVANESNLKCMPCCSRSKGNCLIM